MAIYKTQKTFADRLNEAKSVFKKALDNATALSQEMEAKISEKQGQIAAIEVEIKEIDATNQETQKFITKLEGLV